MGAAVEVAVRSVCGERVAEVEVEVEEEEEEMAVVVVDSGIWWWTVDELAVVQVAGWLDLPSAAGGSPEAEAVKHQLRPGKWQ